MNNSFEWMKQLSKQFWPVYFFPEVERLHFGIVDSRFVSHVIMRHSFQLTWMNAHMHTIGEKRSRCEEELFNIIIMDTREMYVSKRTISNDLISSMFIAWLWILFLQLWYLIVYIQCSHWRKCLRQAEEKWMFERSFIKQWNTSNIGE